MTRKAPLAVAIALLAAACGSSLNSVPVRGSDGEVVALAGEWKGQFDGIANGRRGTIAFALETGRHTADGKVMMYDEGSKADPTHLRIEYLEVANHQVTGRIQDYQDPTCNCVVETHFEGAITGDIIIGTYRVKAQGTDQERLGQWSVERVN